MTGNDIIEIIEKYDLKEREANIDYRLIFSISERVKDVDGVQHVEYTDLQVDEMGEVEFVTWDGGPVDE